MWEELLSIRHLAQSLGLFRLSPEYVSRETDLHAVQTHHARNPRHSEEDSVVLSKAAMAEAIVPMRRWLTHLKWVDEFQQSYDQFRGANWTLNNHDKMIYGEGGFQMAYAHVSEMYWNSADDIVEVSSSGLRSIRSFIERSEDQSENVKEALKTNFTVKRGQFADYWWVREIVDIGKSVEENIAIVREEGLRRNLNIDAFDAMFAMQTNGVMLATKDELPASLMTAYLSTEFDVKEVVVNTDMGKALGARVKLAEGSGVEVSSVTASSIQSSPPIVIWQDYINQELRSELYNYVVYLSGLTLLVSERGIVASKQSPRIVDDVLVTKSQHLSRVEVDAIVEQNCHSRTLPCLLHEEPPKSTKPLIANNEVVAEFQRATSSPPGNRIVTKFERCICAWEESGLRDLEESTQAAAKALWSEYTNFSDLVLQGFQGLYILRDGSIKRDHVLTTVHRLFMKRIAELITRNGKLRYAVNSRHYVISFYQKRTAGWASKACALWSGQSRSFLEIKSLTQLPAIMGLSWTEGVSLVNFLKVAKHRAMRMGCNVDFEDGLLWNHERRYFLTLDRQSIHPEDENEYQGYEQYDETDM